MKKDLYKILGVHEGADPTKIKRAYRRAAKRYHPDISPQNGEKFKEVQTAYETLSDPQKKAAYDQQFIRKPSRDTRSYFPPHFTRPSFRMFDQVEMFFSEIDGFWNDPFNGFLRAYGQNREEFHIEVILTREEAATGCEIPIEIPFSKECRRCYGTGRTRGLICGLCRGEGREKLKEELKILIPSGVRSGTVIRKRIHLDGAKRNLFITLKIQPF